MTTKLLWFALFVFVMIIMSLSYSKKKKKVIFFGDFINDLDAKPNGYISWITNHLKNEGVEENYILVSSLKTGENIYDMYLRLEESVLIKDASIVVLHAGVNDVLNKYLAGTGTDALKFKMFYQAILNKLQAAGIKILVCTPLYQPAAAFHENVKNEIDNYSDIISAIAEENNLLVIDFHRQLASPRVLNNGDALDELMADQVSSNININKFVADEIWKVLREIK